MTSRFIAQGPKSQQPERHPADVPSLALWESLESSAVSCTRLDPQAAAPTTALPKPLPPSRKAKVRLSISQSPRKFGGGRRWLGSVALWKCRRKAVGLCQGHRVQGPSCPSPLTGASAAASEGDCVPGPSPESWPPVGQPLRRRAFLSLGSHSQLVRVTEGLCVLQGKAQPLWPHVGRPPPPGQLTGKSSFCRSLHSSLWTRVP